jgi:hypothetical protein
VYLCGAKKIIDASSTTIELYKDESAVLMDWIYYHEVVSEFSIRHWAEAAAVDSFCKGPLAIRPKDTPFGGCEVSLIMRGTLFKANLGVDIKHNHMSERRP